MAVSIPNQNNLNDVIKASTDLLKTVRQMLAKHEIGRKKERPVDIKKELTHIKTDLQSVVEFVKDMGDINKNIDNVVDNLVAVLGMPSKINKRLAGIKVEVIEAKNLQRAVYELRRVLNTPAEINEILAIDGEQLKLRSLRNAVGQIIAICELPKIINKQIANIKVEEIDSKKLNSIKKILDSIFGKNGLINNIETVAKRLDSFKGIGTMKSLAVWNSILYLNAIAAQIVRFGRYSNKYAAQLKLSIAGTTLILKFIGEFVKVIQAIDDISLISYLMIPIKIKLLRKIVGRIVQLIGTMSELILYLPAAALLMVTLSVINKAIIKFVTLIGIIDEFELKALLMMVIKVPMLARVIRIIARRLIPAISKFNTHLVDMLIAIISLNIANKLINKLSEIIQVISKVKLSTLIINLLKIRLLATNARLIRTLIVRVSGLGRVALMRAAVAIPGLVAALVIVSLYSNVIAVIKKTKFGIFFRVKVRQMVLGARQVKRLIRAISRIISIKRAAKAAIAIKLVNAIIKSFAHVILNILLLTPLMLMFIIFSPIIILVFWLFAKIFRIIIRILARMVSPRIVLVLVAITGVVAMMVLLGVALILLGIVAIAIVDNALNIILFFGVVAVVAVLLGLLGLLLSQVAPMLVAAIYGIAIVALAVFAVLAIAAMLWLLSKIELDQEKIKENVKKVMETVLYIITCLFEDELKDPQGKDSTFTKILKVFGGAVAKIIMALATCIILVATFVSVACILMIAVMLRLLQNLNLNQSKILQNVDMVFDTVERIIARFMMDDPGGKKSNRGILLKLMTWTCPSMAKVFEALLSVAYLFIMFLAVTMVLGIAVMLRLLQNLNLDTKKIRENVDTVLNMVDAIIGRIFGDRKDEEYPSKRGILVTIISWFDEGFAKIVEAALSIVYLALAFTAVSLVLAMASMLRLLQNLDLNADKIMDNVNIVFDTVDLIIGRIFGDRKDEEYPSKRGILTTIISWVDPGLAKIVEAALSVVYLFLMLVAISIVLGIAGLLKCIEDIELDEEKIRSIINSVFNLVDLIINRVFAPTDDSFVPGHGVLGKIIGFFAPGLAKIIDALMAVAYIGLAFVAISVVKGIANSLREIQGIELDEQKITEKVNTIFSICRNIMEQVYGQSDTLLPEPKDRGLFGSIIGFFSPGLADILDALTMIAKLAVVQTAISAVAGIADSLKQIQDIDVDITDAGDKVDKIMNIAENICEKIFSRESKIKFPVPPEERKSVFGALISWAFGGKSDEDRALEAAMKKVEALGIIESAVGALGNILEGAKRIMDMKVDDLAAATIKVDEVMQMSEKLAESIFGANVKLTLPEPSNDDVQAALVELGFDHWWRSSNSGEIASAKAQASMKLAMQRVEVLGLIASAIGSIASIIEGIEKIKTYQAPNLNDIKEKINQVMSTASSISTAIFNQDNTMQISGSADDIKKRIDELKVRIEYAKAGSDGAGELCKSFTNIIEQSKFDEAQVTATKVKLNTAISAIGEIITQMEAIKPEADGKHVRANCELMDRISKTIGSFVKVNSQDVKNSKNITENYIKFFKQVDSMDIKKLQHTDWLMRSWASISRDLKGDFEGLAKTINQHIMPMLQKVNETLEKTTKAQQDIIDALSKPVDINMGGTSTPSIEAPDDTNASGGTTQTGGTSPGKSDPGSGSGSGNAGGNSQGSTGSTKAPRLSGPGNMTVDLNKTYRVKFSDFKDA